MIRLTRREKRMAWKRVTHLFLTRNDWDYDAERQLMRLKIGDYPIRIRHVNNPFFMDIDVHEETYFITPPLIQRIKIYIHWKRNYYKKVERRIWIEASKNLYASEFERDIGRSVGK